LGESYSGIRALADFIRDVIKYQHAVRPAGGGDEDTDREADIKKAVN